MPKDEGGTSSTPRRLTPAEGVVIRTLLAARPISEKERIQEADVPPSTYHLARQRVTKEGWVLDRYLPDLVRVGLPTVTFAIGQPYEEKALELQKRWGDDPSNVLLWSGPQTLFGVFVGRTSSWKGPEKKGFGTDGGLRRGITLTADSRDYGIPVYFDFEASWNRLLGTSTSQAYPHPWFSGTGVEGSEDEEGASPTLSPGALATVNNLVRRPFEAEAAGKAAVKASPFFAPRSQQRALESGWVERRLFLDPLKVPPVQGQEIQRVVLIHGQLLPDRRPQGLLHQLLEDCRVTPFLVATDWKSVLLGALSPVPAAAGTASSSRASVSFVLQRYLQNIEVFREPVQGLSPRVNHRYDRLCSLSTSGGRTSPSPARKG
jgi:hypothetical protein